MAKTFTKEECRDKIIYMPLIEDLYDADIDYLTHLFDETLDDVAKHRKRYPYGERKYILVAKGESEKILRDSFRDYRNKLDYAKTKYWLLGALAGYVSGVAVGMGLSLKFPTQVDAILSGAMYSGLFGGMACGMIADEVCKRRRNRRSGAAEYLTIGAVLPPFPLGT